MLVKALLFSGLFDETNLAFQMYTEFLLLFLKILI